MKEEQTNQNPQGFDLFVLGKEALFSEEVHEAALGKPYSFQEQSNQNRQGHIALFFFQKLRGP
ncbi:MAG: hypothetical protein M3014_06880 [Chloroflexota bacterium]|nr:hypothetical protein [Chloroflexota bacterium]